MMVLIVLSDMDLILGHPLIRCPLTLTGTRGVNLAGGTPEL